MNKKTALRALFLCATLLFAAQIALAAEDLPQFTEEGLELISDSELAIVYADPEANLTPYNEVQLLETHVAFKKNWKRDQNRTSRSIRVTDSDMERIKTQLSAEFTEVFTEVLEEDDGFPVVDHAGENVLLVRAAIIDLDANAPATMRAGNSTTYADSAGEMTLYIEIFDSLTGDMLAKGLDKKRDRQTGYMTWQTSVSNKQAARRILSSWAKVLRGALDEAHAHTGGADQTTD